MNTGPGIANKMMRKGLGNKNEFMYSDGNNKISRVFEMLFKILLSDYVCFCSPSKLNIIGIKIAKLFKKKTFYIMHGYLTYENEINNLEYDKKRIKTVNDFEKYIFRNVNKVYCVSQKFMEYMKEVESEFKDKFDYNYNGLNLNEIEEMTEKYEIINKKKQIISIGGGMRRKNNLIVCKAIEKLNQEKGMDLTFVVIGLPYTDKEEICNHKFVTYYDKLPHEEVLKLMGESYLYIQNSSFETFGLAVIEALFSNCNLLISDRVGSIGVLKSIEERDLIFNTEDIEEISEKIENIFREGNAEKLQQGIDKQEIDSNNTAKLLISKILKIQVANSE